MKTIGAYEAKTHLSGLLEQVEKGERFVITKYGRAIAELIPIPRRDPEKISRAIENLKNFQKTHPLNGTSIKDLIDEGRRF